MVARVELTAQLGLEHGDNLFDHYCLLLAGAAALVPHHAGALFYGGKGVELTAQLGLEHGDNLFDHYCLFLAGAVALVLHHAVVQTQVADALGHRQRDMGNTLCN